MSLASIVASFRIGAMVFRAIDNFLSSFVLNVANSAGPCVCAFDGRRMLFLVIGLVSGTLHSTIRFWQNSHEVADL